jgi:hypothetical protein
MSCHYPETTATQKVSRKNRAVWNMQPRDPSEAVGRFGQSLPVPPTRLLNKLRNESGWKQVMNRAVTCLHLYSICLFTVKMDGIFFSEEPVDFHLSRRRIPEDGTAHNCRCGNLRFCGKHNNLWRMVSSGMLRRVALVRTDVPEELSFFIRVTRIGELGTTLAVTSNRCTLRINVSIAV